MIIPINDIEDQFFNVILGLTYIIKKHEIPFNIFKPIGRSNLNKIYSEEISKKKIFFIKNALSMRSAQILLKDKKENELIEKVLEYYEQNKKTKNITFIEGFTEKSDDLSILDLNYKIAVSLNAEILPIFFLKNFCLNDANQAIQELSYKKISFSQIIFLQNSPFQNSYKKLFYDSLEDFIKQKNSRHYKNTYLFEKDEIKIKHMKSVIGCIPFYSCSSIMRTIDICRSLKAKIINYGNIQKFRVKSVVLCTDNALNILKKIVSDEILLMIPSHREDIFTAVFLAIIEGVKISGVLLIGNKNINYNKKKIFASIFKTSLPILKTNLNIIETLLILKKYQFHVYEDDIFRIKIIQKYIGKNINQNWIRSLKNNSIKKEKFSPSSFKYLITSLAKKTKKVIVLPEGTEPRTIKAASICADKKIATCILLGCPKEIYLIAKTMKLSLNKDVKIINPSFIREEYISSLVKYRQKKGMTNSIAKKLLKDNVILGTMMLKLGKVDGLVSGAINTTANTLRPALQIIKTKNNNSLISSIFFMLFPEKVMIYGDCAINTNPSYEELATIAIQSANSAKAFGIQPKIAMISYSTHCSGSGPDVEKVRKATNLVKLKYPNIVIDGPLQYDAATIQEIGKIKAPNSNVAGKATVLIFPDLNTGNTVYKAVQRCGKIDAIGPILQGMDKPVNDLSRGASVEDIVYTVAITVIQSQKE
ncbi:phosphate acetyltransferase [Candidatus Tachikawaea gelatinosa]|uniref:Phosphate acetyltransferase n=2 Tax=Candidatus Tachikawaea gelatinosa TaxID=1410383 RepID=A0A090BWB4_9ENTR|nr:phosphate acetyltransferase [Candidatus Tachikawaea gelatinosa]